MSDERQASELDAAEVLFTQWFVAQYQPRCIITRPEWHAPKIFRAALNAAAVSSSPLAPTQEGA